MGGPDHLADGRVDAKEPSLLDPVLPVSRGHREDRAFARVDVEERVDAGSEIERLAGRLDGRGRLAGRRRLGRRRRWSCGRGVVRRRVGTAEGGPAAHDAGSRRERDRRQRDERSRPRPSAPSRRDLCRPSPGGLPDRDASLGLGYPPALEHGDGRTAEIPGRRVALGRLFRPALAVGRRRAREPALGARPSAQAARRTRDPRAWPWDSFAGRRPCP